MIRHRDHQAFIVNYLLGALPEADLEHFESCYLEDEALFEELQEVEDELIDDYVNGALTAEQQTLFEQYFLRSSQRREKLECARAMTDHAVAWKVAAESPVAPSMTKAAPAGSTGNLFTLKHWTRPVPAWRQWVAIAAAVLIAAGGGALWLRNRELRRELVAAEANSTKLRQGAEVLSARAAETQTQLAVEQEQAQRLEQEVEQLQRSVSNEARKVVVAAILGVEYLFRGTRGDSEKKIKTLEIPANARLLWLAVEIEKGRFEVFKIILQRSDGHTAWTGGGLKARSVGDKQRLTIAILAENLTAGSYDLALIGVSPEGDAELVGRYYLKVDRREAAR